MAKLAMRIRIFFICLDRRITRRFVVRSVGLWLSIARHFYAGMSGCMGVLSKSGVDAVATPEKRSPSPKEITT